MTDVFDIGSFESMAERRQRQSLAFTSYSDGWRQQREEEEKRKRAEAAERFSQGALTKFAEQRQGRAEEDRRAATSFEGFLSEQSAGIPAADSFAAHTQKYMEQRRPEPSVSREAMLEGQRRAAGLPEGARPEYEIEPTGRSLGRSLLDAGQTALDVMDIPRKKAILPIAQKAIPGDVPLEAVALGLPGVGLPLAAGLKGYRSLTGKGVSIPEEVAEEGLSYAGEAMIPGLGVTKFPKIGRGAAKAGSFAEHAAKYTDELGQGAKKAAVVDVRTLDAEAVGPKPQEFVAQHLARKGEGAPGLTTETFPADPVQEMGRRFEITYRDEAGKPLAYMEVVDTKSGLVAETLVADPAAKLAKGRAVSALLKEADRLGVTGVGGTVTPDAQRLIRGLGRRSATSRAVPLSPLDSAIDKVRKASKVQRKNIAKLKPLRAEEHAEQAARGEEAFQAALAEGKSYSEAFAISRSAQKGALTKALAPGIEWSDDEFTAMTRAIEDFDFGRGLKPDFTRQRARGAFLKLAAHEPIQENEIVTLERIYGGDFGDAIRKMSVKSEETGNRVWRLAQDIWLLPKAVRSAFDVSNPLRQSIILGASHPKEWGASLKPMFKAFGNEEYAKAAYKGLLSDPDDVKVVLKEGTRSVSFGKIFEDTEMLLDPHLSMPAEDPKYIGSLAEKIPGVRMSNRGFVTFSNEVRGKTFKTIVKGLAQDHPEAITPEYLQGLANYLQRAGGIGTLPRGSVTTVLRLMEWSPFYRVSPAQALATIANVKQPYVAKQAARDLGLFFGTGISLLAAAKYTGNLDVEVDPRSTDFGKITIGNTHVNIWGTGQVLARMIARTATGQTKTESGEIVPMQRQKTIGKYLQSGFSPEISLAYDVWQGKNYSGYPMNADKATLKREFLDRTLPLSMLDVLDAVKEYGFLGLAAAPYTALGGSISTYEPSSSTQIAKRFQEKYNRPFSPEADSAVVDTDPELKALRDKGRREGWERGQGLTSQGLEQTRTETEQDIQLPKLAQGVLKGDMAAGPAFVEAWEDYTNQMVGAYRNAYIGKDPRKAEAPAGKALEAYYNIRPVDFPGETEYDTDWRAYFKAKDAAFAELPALNRQAIEARLKSADPVVQRAEAKLKQAKNLLDGLPLKYKGVSEDQQLRIERVRREVASLNKRAARLGILDAPTEKLYELAGEVTEEPTIARIAYALRPGSKKEKEMQNPARKIYLARNADALEMFYPNFYGEETLALTGALERSR